MIASTQKSTIMFDNTAAREKASKTIIQEVQYKDPKVLQDVCNTIANLPPLITPEELEAARSQFAEAALGRAFVLQGGDCAESFQDVRPHIVNQKVRLLEEQFIHRTRPFICLLKAPQLTAGTTPLPHLFGSARGLDSLTVAMSNTTPEQHLPNVQDEDHIGRITIITRFGADKVETVLPPLIQAVHKSGHRLLWMCDPCHGNTSTASSGHKTRHISSILREATTCYRVHREHGSALGGLHLEQTGEFVTECVDGSDMGSEENLGMNYRSLCDPRLSYLQGLTVVRGFVDFAQHIDAKYQAAAGNGI
ncbi:class II DAHP synthetase family protein [Trichophyton equinum CBS 127.97]|uniref:Phospho-2-dehydro-3-deoxyheptonate aldolase n=1 Tax=Trichophyton equinum (strain ATCC MYA-4606 / CBS 127.97) TaxID=559882 RepID=F2PR75_TRIEC|nr:class II DAHP synthetase family protein [Trichophyton equinum CBS 127.97]